MKIDLTVAGSLDEPIPLSTEHSGDRPHGTRTGFFDEPLAILVIRPDLSLCGSESSAERRGNLRSVLLHCQGLPGDRKNNLHLIVSEVMVRIVGDRDARVRDLVRIVLTLRQLAFDKLAPAFLDLRVPSLNIELHSPPLCQLLLNQ